MDLYRLEYVGHPRDGDGFRWRVLEFNADSHDDAQVVRSFFREKGIVVGRLTRLETTEVLVDEEV